MFRYRNDSTNQSDLGDFKRPHHCRFLVYGEPLVFFYSSAVDMFDLRTEASEDSDKKKKKKRRVASHFDETSLEMVSRSSQRSPYCRGNVRTWNHSEVSEIKVNQVRIRPMASPSSPSSPLSMQEVGYCVFQGFEWTNWVQLPDLLPTPSSTGLSHPFTKTLGVRSNLFVRQRWDVSWKP